MDEKLKPCPWCGSIPKMKHEKVGGHHFWSVECANDDSCTVVVATNDFETEEEAIEAWNDRGYC